MAKKKSQMQEQIEKDEIKVEVKFDEGEQMTFIDLTPEELKAIAPQIKRYYKVVRERIKLNAEEKTLKDEIREYAHKSAIKRLPDGSFKFKADGMIVEITPQDEKVSVKEEKQKKTHKGSDAETA